MKRFLSFLYLVFLASWSISAAASPIDLTDRVSDVAVYSPGASNAYGKFSAESGMSFSLVNPDGSSAGPSNYFYRPPDSDYNGILPVFDESTPPDIHSWSFTSSRTRLSFADAVKSFSIDMGDKGEDADTIYLELYKADGGLIHAISGEIGAGVNSFHTLNYNSGSFDIAYVDFWGVDPLGENTVYFNNVSFTPVPLPGSLLLLGSALVTCMLSRRKRRLNSSFAKRG